jgi:hypothetical protein
MWGGDSIHAGDRHEAIGAEAARNRRIDEARDPRRSAWR